MTHRAKLTLALDDAREAHALLAALAPDDDGHARLRVEGDALVVEAESTTALGLLRTLDEIVAAAAAARKATRMADG